MALRLLLCRNQWKTKKAGILLGSINHHLCQSSPSSTTTATTLGPHVPDAHKNDRIIFLAQFAMFMINDTNTRRDDSKRIAFVRVASAMEQQFDEPIYYISPELYSQLRHCLPDLGGAVYVPDAHKNDRMIFLAQFAVFMMNDTNTRRDDSKRLEFVRVVSALEQQFDEPIYYIFLEAASIDDDDDGRLTKFYGAKFLIRRICLELMSWRELESPPTTT